MEEKMKKSLCFTICCIFAGVFCFGQTGAAHEFLVKPSSFNTQPGEVNSVEVLSAHVFMESEEMEPLEQVEVYKVSENTKKKIIPLHEVEDKFALKGEFRDDAQASVICGHRKGMLWSKTTTGWKQEGKKKLTGVISSGKYEKFSKALVTASVDNNMLFQPVGHRLELIPLDDPATFQQGGKLRFQVLFEGRPIATEVFATYDGFSSQPNTYAYYSNSDEAGKVTVKIGHQGVWMVRVQHEVDSVMEDYDKEVLRAVLLFNVAS